MIAAGHSVTFVRKLMQSIAAGGLAACLLLIEFASGLWEAMALLILAKILGAAAIGGYACNHMDIGPAARGHAHGHLEHGRHAARDHRRVHHRADPRADRLLGAGVPGHGGVRWVGMVTYLLLGSGEKQFD